MCSVSELVTGEAVVLDLRLARLASRGLAFTIDTLIQLISLVVLLLIFSGGGGFFDGAAATAITLVLLVLVMIGYPVLVETLTRGRSVGKLAMGLRVVREDGGPIRFRQALIRGLTGFFVDFWVVGLSGAVAIFVSLGSKQGKRVGDFLAGTVVVRERMPRDTAPVVAMPPGMAGWASGLNVGAVPDGLALTVRQYLSRYSELNVAAQVSLGAQLAQEVGQHLGVPLPQDATSAHYLAAVLAERRNREHARLQPPPTAVAPPPLPATPQQPTPDTDNPFTAPG
jgi:uncharacterized RDD family membrane protein YckC